MCVMSDFVCDWPSMPIAPLDNIQYNNNNNNNNNDNNLLFIGRL